MSNNITVSTPEPVQATPMATPDGNAETPEPWYYDEANDRHWYEPHNHWHPGPPPPPEERDGDAMED